MGSHLRQLLLESNNIISTKALLENGYTKYDIKKMVANHILLRVQRGFYVPENELEDEFYINQVNNAFMIYSNETALYLHNLTDRYPHPLSVTTKSGYHLRKSNLKVYYTDNTLLKLGMMTMKSPQGHLINVYDKERTICDIIKNKKRIDPQVYVQELQIYFINSKPSLRKLSLYSKQMNIQDKVMNIVELYIKP